MIAALLTAGWLGLLTAISPCPLATNIAAVGFLGRHASRPGRAVLAGALYVLGRTVCYTALAAALSAGMLAAVQTSTALGRFGAVLVGPVLIIAGAVMLDLVPLPTFGRAPEQAAGWVGARAGGPGGLAGATLLGVLFALSFCPTSAAMFFGGLLPLAARSDSVLWVPAAFGVATGLPVLVFAALLAGGSNRIGRIFERVQQIEKRLRIATALLILAIGLNLTARALLGPA